MLKRMIAMLLCLCMLTTVCPVTVFADPEPEAQTVVETTSAPTEEVKQTEPKPEPKPEQKTEQKVEQETEQKTEQQNDQQPEQQNDQQTEETPSTCTCTTACAADAPNAECSVCSGGGTCIGKAAEENKSENPVTTTQEEPSCTCTTACTAEQFNKECSLCATDIGKCKCKQQEKPQEPASVTVTVRVEVVKDDGAPTSPTKEIRFSGDETTKTYTVALPSYEGYTISNIHPSGLKSDGAGNYTMEISRPTEDTELTITVTYTKVEEEASEPVCTCTEEGCLAEECDVCADGSIDTCPFYQSKKCVCTEEECVEGECPACILGDFDSCPYYQNLECICTEGECLEDSCPACGNGMFSDCTYYQSLVCTCPEDDCLEECEACQFGKFDDCEYRKTLPDNGISTLKLGKYDETIKYDTYYFQDANGDVMDSWTQIVADNDLLSLPVAQEKTGAKFLGWNVNGTVYGASAVIPITNATGAEIYVTPSFQTVGYVFFLDKNGAVCHTAEGTPGEAVGADEFSSAELAANATLEPSESIVGWKNGDTEVSALTYPAGSVTLKPEVKAGHWITFFSEGGSYVAPQFYIAETSAPAAPTRVGYTFKYWATAAEGTEEFAFGSELVADIELHAVWEANTNTAYTVVIWTQCVTDGVGDDPTYDFYSSRVYTATTGSTVTVRDADKQAPGTGFHLGHCDDAKEVAPDGSTVLNVYFDRDVMTISFKATEWQWIGGRNGHWEEVTIYQNTIQGLYGSTFAQNGVSWPTGYTWTYENNNSEMTFMDSFIHPNGTSDNISFKGTTKQKQNRTIYHYKENLDGTYTLANTATTDLDGFQFTNKYNGFTVAYYSSSESGGRSSTSAGSSLPTWHDAYDDDLYVFHTRNSYSFVFKNTGISNGAEVFIDANTVSKKYEESLSDLAGYVPDRPSHVPENFTFSGWYADSACTVLYDFSKTMPAGNVAVYAKWVAPTVKATVYLTFAGDDSKPITVEYGARIDKSDLPTPTDANGRSYVWCTKNGNNYTPFNFDTQLTQNVELYPYYVSGKTFKVTYNLANKDYENLTPQDGNDYFSGARAEVLAPPEDLLSTFSYWSDSDGKTYQPKASITITGDITLTAVYGNPPEKGYITYHANFEGTKAEWKAGPYKVNEQITPGGYPADKPAPTGYTFAGWSLSPTDSPVTRVVIKGVNGNDLYAIWEKDENQTQDTEYTVKHVVDGVEQVEDTKTHSVSYKVEYYKDNKLVETSDAVSNSGWIGAETIVAVDSSKINTTDKYVGYKFVNTDPATIPTSYSVAAGAETGAENVIKVYYTINKYTVTWEDWNGTELEIDTDVPYGTTPTYDGATPTRAATARYTYTFTGWSPKVSAVEGNVTYTAVYSVETNTYTVTWKNWNGTVLETDTNVPFGATPTFNSGTPARANAGRYTYSFKSWTPKISTVTGDVTYTATFNATYHPAETEEPTEPRPTNPNNPTDPTDPPAPTDPTVPEEPTTLPAQPDAEDQNIPDNDVPLALDTIPDEDTPLANRGVWALVNLILTILTVLGSLLLLLGYLGKKDQKATDEDGNVILDENGEETLAYSLKKKGFWRLFSLVPAIGAIIAFILTEDMRLPMVLVDRWTLLMIVIALIQVIVAFFSKKKKEEPEKEDQAVNA